MAEAEQSNSVKNTPINQHDVDVSQTTDGKKPEITVPKITGGWWVVVAVIVGFATLGMVAACFAMQRSFVRHDGLHTVGQGMSVRDFDTDVHMRRGSGDRMQDGMMRWGGYGSDTSTNSSRVFGVVTAVNDTTLTVAGNGTTTKIIVTDDTTYMGDDKPAKVNDTIMAVGTKDGDTITATRVMLQRQ